MLNLAYAQFSSGAASSSPVAPAYSPAGGAPATVVPRAGQASPVQNPAISNVPVPQPAQGQRAQEPASRETQRAGPPTTSAGATESTERNEFQDFVAVSTGRNLPIFGQSLFQNVPTTFAPVEQIPVTPDYVIGPGDELVIRAWGQVDIDYRAIVDRTGAVNIPRVGNIVVSGIKYQDLSAFVKTAVSRVFRNFDLIVTMGQLRSLQVFVVGQAQRPGVYTVSSLSTLVNAVFAAGGPSPRGSMRAIQLKRGNRVVTELDLYDLLVFGDKSKDAQLLPGDVIHFPPIGPLAALSGSVNNPAIFELRRETSLSHLLQWAGGLTTTAQVRSATIERIDERKSRIVDQFSIDKDSLGKPIHDGDVISVYSISQKFENAVTLRGQVAAPLRYPYREGMRIRDLIPEKEALITPDYYQRKNLAAQVSFIGQRQTTQATVSGQGQPRTSLGGQVSGDRQRQLIAEVRGLTAEINWDYALIERMNETDLSAILIPFNLGKAILEADPSQNLALRPGDVVTVFSKADITVPVGRQSRLVQLEGEINHAGVYMVTPGETLRQVVTRVGGLSPNAYLFGAEFTRESTRAQQQLRLQETLDRMEQDIQRRAATRAQSALAAEDAASAAQAAESQRALIARLRTLKPTGRIVLELPEDPGLKDLPDLELEDGDRFVVPSKPSMINVFGSVYNETAFIYKPEKRVTDYLAQAGGATRDADSGSIYVIRADGSVISRRQSGFLASSLEGARLMPGDTIVVPEEFEKTTFTKNLKDWTQILYQFGLGAAALNVLRN